MKPNSLDKPLEIPIMPQPDDNILELAHQLLLAVQKNNHEEIATVVSTNSEVLRHEYSAFDDQTILIIACNEQHGMNNVTGETIKTLINLGAKCNEPSKNDHWEPIHYTALNANKEKMEALIQFLSPDQLNSLVCCSKQAQKCLSFCYSNQKIQNTYSNNALSILLKYGNQATQFDECCQLLIEIGIDVNQGDSNGVTPSDLIWKFRNDKFTRLLKGKSGYQGTLKSSFGLLRVNSIDRFISTVMNSKDANCLDGKEENLSSCTLLQMCCAKGQAFCVSHLLERGAAVNKTIEKNPEHPLMIAMNGYHEDIVTLFLKRYDLILPVDILLKLQMLYNNKKKIPILDKWMKVILKRLRRNDKNSFQKHLTVTDDLDRTVLHYSTHYKCKATTLTLLSMGASLISEDLFGYTPLDSIEASVLEKFLDNCVSGVQDEEDPSGLLQVIQDRAHQFCVKIDYGNLVADQQESVFLDHMIKGTNLNHLLNHSVVASYLTLKWDKFKWWVYFNLSLYCIAYFSLLLDGFVLSTTMRTSNVLLWIAYALLILRDTIHVLILRWRYVRRTETIIDFLLILAVTYIILSTWLPDLDNRNVLVACSIVFLTSTLGIFTQLGNLSLFTVKVTLLKQISINFFKAMAFYMFPVLAFFFSFYMLSETKSSMFFKMLFDTIALSAGDLDSDFPDQFKTNPIFGHMVYLIFVVLIGIVLHNLLIGLAVSDLQDVQKQAQFICKKEQAKYIVNFEKIIFRQFRQSYYFKKMFHKLLSALRVFGDDQVLTVQSHHSGGMYIKDHSGIRKKIHDQDIVQNLQRIFKNLTLDGKKRNDEAYSIKSLLEEIRELKVLVAESLENNKSGRGNEISLF